MEKVLIVDDHTLIAATLTGALRSRGYDARPCTPRSDAYILEVVGVFKPAVVLLDLELDVDRVSIPLVGPLGRAGAAVVMLTATTDEIRLAECVEAGAAAILSKAARLDEVVEAIETARNGGSAIPDERRKALLDALAASRADQEQRRAPFERLTPREQEVLDALMQGKTANVIAAESRTSVATVRNHIQRLLDKLDVSSQLAAVTKAQSAGWSLTETEHPDR